MPDSGAGLIAIVGNVTSVGGGAERQMAEAAARDLGAQLARSGHHIVVYSKEQQYAEPHVVSGYVSSGAAQPGSIHVRYPQGNAEVAFEEWATGNSLFVAEPDPSSDWEVSFYASLREVDGALLIGGGRSTFISGLICLGYQKAVVAIPAFGGYARKIWGELQMREGVLSRSAWKFLGEPVWTADLAERAILLFAEHAREIKRQEELQRIEAARTTSGMRLDAWLALAFFLVAASIALGSVLWQLPLAVLAPSLAVGAVCAGVSGSTIRALADLLETKTSAYSGQTLIRSALGVVAGVFTALLIAVPQITAESRLPNKAAALITEGDKLVMRAERLGAAMPTALFAAFVAAFTIDQFYRKLRELQVPGPALPGKESK